jgi:UDP-N-acetyl-D-mannosaminuronate dehydrogenase
MKACFKNINKFTTPEQIEVVQEFTKFLQSNLPLNQDVYITFVPERIENMTTGVRTSNSQIFVLAGQRLLIDVLRTLSHEWVHEYQHQKMGLKDTDKIQDIGGPEENMSNVLSGIFLKKFNRDYPQYTNVIFGEQN